jgi:primosomal protein N' (replication factor Y) (superfamily II helicase)
MNRARILLLTAGVGPFDYRVPAGMDLQLGHIVDVPLGPRRISGIVWEDADGPPANAPDAPPHVPDAKLRSIFDKHPLPPLPAPLMQLIRWTADYYLANPAAVARMAVPSSSLQNWDRIFTEYKASTHVPARMTPQRTAALAAIGATQASLSELSQASGASVSVLRGLAKAGALEAVHVAMDTRFPALNHDYATPALSAEQAKAANILSMATDAAEFAAFLLDGVTGSGKTEVYFEAVAQALRMGKQTLILLPEIALTAPILKRFVARFGAEPLVWHSGLRQSERRRAYRAISNGDAQVIIGARSALFLPMAQLGVIIVDEAHETSFKQEDGVHYHARDVAVMRAQFEGCPVILATATPALESLAQVEAGRYQHLRLPSRFGGATMPNIRAIDLRDNPPDRGTWIAPELALAVQDRMDKQEQCLLFLNRRGYAPLTLCRTCGHRIKCPNCTSWMVEHKLVRRMACHHCGHVMPPPDACPQCGAEDAMVPCGPGVERIADEVRERFPTARTIVVTSDTMWSPAKVAEFVELVDSHAIDIIIGTQLVTKGYHFPDLTLVGVIDADLGLEGGDLRAGERTFQQIAQVAGRAGRGAKPGEVMIQTRMPDAPVMAALVSGDRDGFYAAESAARRAIGVPPYGRMAAIIVSAQNAELAQRTARDLAEAAPQANDVMVLGPAPAPLSVLRGRHRYRLLVHASRSFALQAMVRSWLGSVDWPARVRVTVDVDPYSFM